MWTEYSELRNEMNKVEEYINKNISSRNKLLASIVNDLVSSGGKRLRPASLIISSKFGKYNRKKSISAASAIEILHTATLVHDDIIDNSKFRRENSTVSDKHGSEMAIYVGDFLFTKAVLMLSNGIAVDKLDIVAKAIKVICEGEAVMKFVKDKGGIEKTKNMLEKYIIKGVKILDSLPENKYKEIFKKMIMDLKVI